MQQIHRSLESLKYTFDFNHAPVLTVELGESFTVETEDAPSGTYRTLEDAGRLLDAWYLNYSPPLANPVTGPIFVRGVNPEDTLVVHVEGLDVDVQAATYWRPGHKPLGDSLRWNELSKPTLVIGRIESSQVTMDEAATWEDGTVRRHPLGLRVRRSPFIGTIGLAPQREIETSVVGQGSWGGNLDARDVCPGTRVLIPAITRVVFSTWGTSTPARATPNSTGPQWRHEAESPCAARQLRGNGCHSSVWRKRVALSRWRAYALLRKLSGGPALSSWNG
jgi:amidase